MGKVSYRCPIPKVVFFFFFKNFDIYCSSSNFGDHVVRNDGTLILELGILSLGYPLFPSWTVLMWVVRK